MTILVIAEHDNKVLAAATLNTVAAAAKIGGSIHVLVAGLGVRSVAEEASKVSRVTKVLVADNSAYSNQLPENVGPPWPEPRPQSMPNDISCATPTKVTAPGMSQ